MCQTDSSTAKKKNCPTLFQMEDKLRKGSSFLVHSNTIYSHRGVFHYAVTRDAAFLEFTWNTISMSFTENGKCKWTALKKCNSEFSIQTKASMFFFYRKKI